MMTTRVELIQGHQLRLRQSKLDVQGEVQNLFLWASVPSPVRGLSLPSFGYLYTALTKVCQKRH